MTRKDILKEVLKSIKSFKMYIIAVVLAFVLLIFFTPVFINGHSMDNTYHDKQFVIGLNRQFTKFERKDIICVRTDDKNIIKRIIGKPGDTIKISNNKVFVNEKIISEDYLKEPMITDDYDYCVLGEDEYFIMGDNRNNSVDSRSIGPVRYSKIICKILW